jgi:hypothetical protein
MEQIKEWIRCLERDLKQAKTELQEHFRRHGRSKNAHQSQISFLINTFKFSSMSTPNLSVPSGTAVGGISEPLDASTPPVVLPNSAFKTGSCKWSVVPGPSGNAPGFSVAPSAVEEDFSISEDAPGSASDGQINFDAQDVNGNQLPTSSAILSFTATAPPPPPPAPVAVASQIVFNSIPAPAAAASTTTN